MNDTFCPLFWFDSSSSCRFLCRHSKRRLRQPRLVGTQQAFLLVPEVRCWNIRLTTVASAYTKRASSKSRSILSTCRRLRHIMPGVGGKRKQPESSEHDRMVALHRARIVEWSPTAITALAATADGTVVAAARENGSLEIWNTEHWQCIKVARVQSP